MKEASGPPRFVSENGPLEIHDLPIDIPAVSLFFVRDQRNLAEEWFIARHRDFDENENSSLRLRERYDRPEGCRLTILVNGRRKIKKWMDHLWLLFLAFFFKLSLRYHFV